MKKGKPRTHRLLPLRNIDSSYHSSCRVTGTNGKYITRCYTDCILELSRGPTTIVTPQQLPCALERSPYSNKHKPCLGRR